jgi:hypothetical protein
MRSTCPGDCVAELSYSPISLLALADMSLSLSAKTLTLSAIESAREADTASKNKTHDQVKLTMAHLKRQMAGLALRYFPPFICRRY